MKFWAKYLRNEGACKVVSVNRLTDLDHCFASSLRTIYLLLNIHLTSKFTKEDPLIARKSHMI